LAIIQLYIGEQGCSIADREEVRSEKLEVISVGFDNQPSGFLVSGEYQDELSAGWVGFEMLDELGKASPEGFFVKLADFTGYGSLAVGTAMLAELHQGLENSMRRFV